MPRHITHVIYGLDIGGTEKQLLLLLPLLQEQNTNDVVCLTGHGPIGPALEAAGIPVTYLNGRGYADFLMVGRVWRQFRQKKPDIVVTYLLYADIVGRIIARLAGVRRVITSHRSSLFGPPWRHYLDRATRFLVTTYTVQTEATKELLHRVLKIPREKLVVIPNAVSPTALPSSPSSVPPPSRPTIFSLFAWPTSSPKRGCPCSSKLLNVLVNTIHM